MAEKQKLIFTILVKHIKNIISGKKPKKRENDIKKSRRSLKIKSVGRKQENRNGQRKIEQQKNQDKKVVLVTI